MKKWFAVIGDPIAHSMSPAMHNEWFKHYDVDASYLPIQVAQQNLQEAVQSLKLLGAGGWNVTIPHKEAIIPYLDEVDEMAEKMGAVNTVVKQQDGTLKGYNTDGLGFVRSLEEVIGEAHRSKEILLIGAGGAARGIAFALVALGYTNITIANRTVEKAQAICQELSVQAHSITLQRAEECLDQFDLLIQTTPAGLKHGQLAMPFALTKLKSTAIVADIVYNPLMTPFLAQAEAKGATVVTGLGMFIHQGALAFEYWTTIKPAAAVVEPFLLSQLGGNE